MMVKTTVTPQLGNSVEQTGSKPFPALTGNLTHGLDDNRCTNFAGVRVQPLTPFVPKNRIRKPELVSRSTRQAEALPTPLFLLSIQGS
jgi:hypothetical protein